MEHNPARASTPAMMRFGSPWGTRVLNWIKKWVLSLFIYFALIGLSMWPIMSAWKDPPGWIFLLAFSLPAIPASALFIYLARAYPGRLRITAEHCIFGRWPFRQFIALDDVDLVSLNRPENTFGRAIVLSVHTGRKRRNLWLKATDAEQCFDALRTLSQQAGGMLGDDSFVLSEDPRHVDRAMEAVRRDLYRKARRARRAALVFGIVTTYCTVLLVLTTSAVASDPLRYVGGVIFTLTMAAGAFSFKKRSAFLQKRAQAIDIEEIIRDMQTGDEVVA